MWEILYKIIFYYKYLRYFMNVYKLIAGIINYHNKYSRLLFVASYNSIKIPKCTRFASVIAYR